MFSDAPVGKSWVALTLAVIEAVCVFAVMTAKAGILVGAVAIFMAGWAKYLHRDILRIPALLVAILASLINLYLVGKFFSLRNRPAAAWRKRPLTASDKLRLGLVLSFGMITLALALTEIYFHRSFHHTLM